MISKQRAGETVEDYVQRVSAAVDATRIVQLKVGDIWQVKTSKTDNPARIRIIAIPRGMVEWASLGSKLKAKESQQTFRAAFEPSWEIEGEK